MASSMAIKTLATSPLTRSPFTKSLSSLVRLVSYSTKSDNDDDAIPTAGISRPLSDILKELNKKVPDSLVKLRIEDASI
ncbi:GDSL-like Lipase/Acylhydrolase superfamily protein isoform 1 [Hibiscus syriacus]|uniref:GDSL-like Lipase/Acylhydrolase superfamily protein isoform 1 n=1 Tax=Hibiscus syriacus TaxID=106335 RepID=A0A6A3C8C1_HIBSY|nr:GDSL-like Lipase/Acylhydrolase superfamily protein isoform 1 [Hibiscus syriacus]